MNWIVRIWDRKLNYMGEHTFTGSYASLGAHLEAYDSIGFLHSIKQTI